MDTIKRGQTQRVSWPYCCYAGSGLVLGGGVVIVMVGRRIVGGPARCLRRHGLGPLDLNKT